VTVAAPHSVTANGNCSAKTIRHSDRLSICARAWGAGLLGHAGPGCVHAYKRPGAIEKDSQHHHLAAMEPRTDPRVAILPVVHAFAVRDTALVVSNVFVAIGSDENALPVLGTFLKVAHVYLFALPLHFDPKLTNGLDREIAMLV
jgi:hypothetical protein